MQLGNITHEPNEQTFEHTNATFVTFQEKTSIKDSLCGEANLIFYFPRDRTGGDEIRLAQQMVMAVQLTHPLFGGHFHAYGSP